MWESMWFFQVAHYMTSFSFRLSPHLNLVFMSNYYIMVYVYNFTCFELKRMDLKSHRKGRNQKNFSIFCIKLTSMQNCKSQIQWIGQVLFVPHQYIYIYIYISKDLMWESMRFYQMAHYMTSFSFRLPPHLNLAFMSNYYVMANAFIQMY